MELYILRSVSAPLMVDLLLCQSMVVRKVPNMFISVNYSHKFLQSIFNSSLPFLSLTAISCLCLFPGHKQRRPFRLLVPPEVSWDQGRGRAGCPHRMLSWLLASLLLGKPMAHGSLCSLQIAPEFPSMPKWETHTEDTVH